MMRCGMTIASVIFFMTAEYLSMAKVYSKKNFPVDKIRRFIEPGPIVLVSSSWKGKMNIMTMGWHCMMEFTPSLFGCIISNGNESFEMIRRSRECVVNLPTFDM